MCRWHDRPGPACLFGERPRRLLRKRLQTFSKTHLLSKLNALLGTWESTLPAGTPKSIRCVKHITPTHWTWVAYDRDTKVAFSACGGIWALKGDKYEETNEFATEDMKHVRGKAFAFNYKIDGDKWFLKGGPDLEIQVDDLWVQREVKPTANRQRFSHREADEKSRLDRALRRGTGDHRGRGLGTHPLSHQAGYSGR